MKKLLFVAVALAATSFASCGSKCNSTAAVDSTAVDSDSVVTDSDSVVADSLVADSTVVK